MEAIFKTGNVYVFVEGEMREDVNENNVEELIFEKNGDDVHLYGGRVKIGYFSYHNGYYVRVDGMKLFDVQGDIFGEYLSISQVVAFLNQIENLGIDPFLSNYRIQLEAAKQEYINLAEKIEQSKSEDASEKYTTLLIDIFRKINRLTFLVFACLVNMNAGLENQYYIDAHNTIMNLYF